MPRFSSRTSADLTSNRLAVAVAERTRAGLPLIDLTLSNPTRAGFEYPRDLLAPLAGPRALTYEPQPLGSPEARRAVAADYARRGLAVEADRIVLTASTSEAYSFLFKLVADPGDEIAVPRPSYPLFEHLVRLDGLVPRPYDLEYHGRWTIDWSTLDNILSPRTRAVLIVSPNNPTGSFVSREDIGQLLARCVPPGVAIVADEVFAEYELERAPAGGRPALVELDDGLVFSLGGLSKAVGLPQVKLGWIAAAGQPSVVDEALTRLEVICDTYLSVSTPVQVAAAELLWRGGEIRAAIQRRIGVNYARLIALAGDVPACRVLRTEGGWYAVLHVPTLRPEEELVLELVTADGVLVHPGYFFDFPRESYLVVSLLVPEPAFAAAIERVLARAILAPPLPSRRP